MLNMYLLRGEDGFSTYLFLTPEAALKLRKIVTDVCRGYTLRLVVQDYR